MWPLWDDCAIAKYRKDNIKRDNRIIICRRGKIASRYTVHYRVAQHIYSRMYNRVRTDALSSPAINARDHSETAKSPSISHGNFYNNAPTHLFAQV